LRNVDSRRVCRPDRVRKPGVPFMKDAEILFEKRHGRLLAAETFARRGPRVSSPSKVLKRAYFSENDGERGAAEKPNA